MLDARRRGDVMSLYRRGLWAGAAAALLSMAMALPTSCVLGALEADRKDTGEGGDSAGSTDSVGATAGAGGWTAGAGGANAGSGGQSQASSSQSSSTTGGGGGPFMCSNPSMC